MEKIKIYFLIFFFSFYFSVLYSNCFPEVFQYLEPKMNYSCQDVSSEYKQAQLVFIDSNPTMFFIKPSKEPITSQSEIKEMLDSYLIYKSNFSEVLLKAKNSAFNFEATNKGPQKNCLQYLGMDTHPCNDIESCKVAAFSVPQTAIAVYAPGFLDAMLDYKQKINDLNNSLNSLNLLLSSKQNFSNYSNYNYIKEILRSMNDVEKKLESYNSNPLMLNKSDEDCLDKNKAKLCFEYCPKLTLPNDWQETKERLLASSIVLENLSSNENLAQKISENSNNWLMFLKKRYSIWDNLQSEIKTLFSSINSSLNSKKWVRQELLEKFNIFAQDFDSISERVKNGEFFVAINEALKLKKDLQILKEEAESLDLKISKLEKSKSNILLSLDYLKQANPSAFESYNSKFDELKNASFYPIESKKLDDLLSFSYSLEKDLLAEIGKIKVNLKDQENQTNNISSKQEKTTQIPSSIQLFASCPLSFISFFLLVVATIKKRNQRI